MTNPELTPTFTTPEQARALLMCIGQAASRGYALPSAETKVFTTSLEEFPSEVAKLLPELEDPKNEVEYTLSMLASDSTMPLYDCLGRVLFTRTEGLCGKPIPTASRLSHTSVDYRVLEDLGRHSIKRYRSQYIDDRLCQDGISFVDLESSARQTGYQALSSTAVMVPVIDVPSVEVAQVIEQVRAVAEAA